MTALVREIPQSIEAEICVIGSMMLSPDCIPDVAEVVRSADFMRPSHRVIFDALCKMHRAGKAIDLVTLPDYLASAGLLDKAGGADYLSDIVSGVPSAAAWRHYAETVCEKSKRRQLIAIGDELADQASHPGSEVSDLLDRFQSKLYALDAREVRLSGAVADAGDVSADVLKRTENAWRNPDCFVGLRTGIASVDKATGGLRPGNYAVLAAVTSGGKTSLACSIAAAVCKKGMSVLFVSAEMTPAELMERFVAAESGVFLSRIRNGRLREGTDDWDRLTKADAIIAQWKLRIIGRSMTVAEIAASARKFQNDLRRPVDFIIVDYLQRIKGGGRTRYEQVSSVSADLKLVALDLGVPILALAQLRREVGQVGRLPCLHDVKESGEIENDADLILLLHHPESAEPDAFDSLPVWLKIDKNRNGPCTPWPNANGDMRGSIVLKWKPSVTRFSWPVERGLLKHAEIS
ncbi:MAG: replicative DNA helicase [Planctomycetota bacterium]|nr:replicative DNA helicase [Planctomycetota bacterium]